MFLFHEYLYYRTVELLIIIKFTKMKFSHPLRVTNEDKRVRGQVYTVKCIYPGARVAGSASPSLPVHNAQAVRYIRVFFVYVYRVEVSAQLVEEGYVPVYYVHR